MAHLNAYLLWEKYAATYFSEANSILEIGPSAYPSFYEINTKRTNGYTIFKTIDLNLDYISNAPTNPNFIKANDPYHYPFPNHEFDIVFSDQVLAHVDRFWEWYIELARIVKPGGYVITINSYSYPLCPSPKDSWRVSSDGMKILNDYAGLKTIISITESLELEKFGIPKKSGFYYPGPSFVDPYNTGDIKLKTINRIKTSWNKFIFNIPILRALLMAPVNCAFDSITIAQKI